MNVNRNGRSKGMGGLMSNLSKSSLMGVMIGSVSVYKMSMIPAGVGNHESKALKSIRNSAARITIQTAYKMICKVASARIRMLLLRSEPFRLLRNRIP